MGTATTLVFVLSQLRDELPPHLRSAPKRALLESHLRHEHALLRSSSSPALVPEVAANLVRRGTTLRASATKRDEAVSRQAPSRSCRRGDITYEDEDEDERDENDIEHIPPRMVHEMCRKARLKRCFRQIRRNQGNDGDERRPPRPQSQLTRFNHLDALPEPANSIPETRGRRRDTPAGDVSLARPEPSHQGGDIGDDLMRRRILARRFVRASPPSARARRDWMDLGGEGEGQTRGAPSFTVGGSSSVPRSRGLGGQQRYAEEALVDDAGEGTVEAQRTGLLRRILHAMRESVGARAREMEEDISTAPPSPGSQDHVSRAQALVDVQQRGHLNERPPVPDSRRTPSSSTSREHVPIDAVAQRLQSPLVHPRQVTRTENAYRAVFEALMRLLPPPIVGTGGGSNDGRDVARMQAAAVRCGSQCQGYIHSLQQGVQVIRTGEAGEEIPCKLTLRGATNSHGGASLVLEDLEISSMAESPGSIDTASLPPTGTPMSERIIPLARLARVRCLTRTGNDLFDFAILAVRTSRGVAGNACRSGGRMRGGEEDADFIGGGVERQGGSQGSREPLILRQEVEPFGRLRAASDDQLCALVLGIASVKSALDSPFRTRHPSGQPGNPATGFPSSLHTASAAACLPWQGARVSIAALAPSLTMAGAAAAVEAEARRVGLENGVGLDQQGLLICTDRCHDDAGSRV